MRVTAKVNISILMLALMCIAPESHSLNCPSGTYPSVFFDDELDLITREEIVSITHERGEPSEDLCTAVHLKKVYYNTWHLKWTKCQPTEELQEQKWTFISGEHFYLDIYDMVHPNVHPE